MALRFSSKAAQIAVAGTVFNHGLAAIPDEWSGNLRGPGAGAATLYLNAAPTSTSMTWAASGAAGTADVFCAVNHTIIK